VNESASKSIESLNESAGRCAAALTTRLMNHLNQLPPDAQRIDPGILQQALALAFEQGANWMADRALKIATNNLPPVNRSPA
jgi:hypothetical protein